MRCMRALVLRRRRSPCCRRRAHAATELSTTDRLKDRREVAAGTRAYCDRLPGRPLLRQRLAHHRRDGRHLGAAAQARRRHLVRRRRRVGRARDALHERPRLHPLRLPPIAGLRLAPHRLRARRPPRGAVRPELANPAQTAKTVTVKVDVHSELLGAYPWTGSDGHPTAADNLQRHRRLPRTARSSSPTGARCPAPRPTTTPRSSAPTRAPEAGETGAGFRGPQPGTVCKADEKVAPSACDDGPHGKGAGGQLRYRVTVAPRARETVWIAVAGSDRGLDDARKELDVALHDPAAQLRAKIEARDELAARSVVDLPGDRRLQEAVEWGKQNLADLTQTATDLKMRFVDQGKAYPAPDGTIKRATFFGAGYPDYPWLFATDGEYTAFPAVALGQFETDRGAPARAARRLGPAQRPQRQGRARDRHRRLGLLRRRQGPGQHRRVGQVPERGRARLALDGRQPLPRRPLRLLQAHAALRHRRARRRQGRLARRASATSSARAWARRSSTTPST